MNDGEQLVRTLLEQLDECKAKLAASETLGKAATDVAEHWGKRVNELNEQLAESERLLEPCRHDTDTQTDAGYPRTTNDILSLLSAYIADFLPDKFELDDKYYGAWERQARKVIEPLMERLALSAAAEEDGIDRWNDLRRDVKELKAELAATTAAADEDMETWKNYRDSVEDPLEELVNLFPGQESWTDGRLIAEASKEIVSLRAKKGAYTVSDERESIYLPGGQWVRKEYATGLEARLDAAEAQLFNCNNTSLVSEIYENAKLRKRLAEAGADCPHCKEFKARIADLVAEVEKAEEPLREAVEKWPSGSVHWPPNQGGMCRQPALSQEWYDKAKEVFSET